MHFIILILLVALFIFLFILLSVFGFVRSIFGFGRNKNKTNDTNDQIFDQQTQHKSKVFEENEGEYVDYEELKD